MMMMTPRCGGCFLDYVKDDDIRFTDTWKEDLNSMLTFIGLFSAIVTAFIIEFYKKLSPDPSNRTAALPNGTAMVWVNALWLISLVLSLTCALIATLLQHWARRYIETPKFSSVLRHRARVRSLLLTGSNSYKIPVMAEMLPTLFHLSVYLFLAGLVITFHTIQKKVAIAVDVAVGFSGLTYLVLSVLPCLDVRCPYRTPVSKILWYPCRTFLSFAAPFLRWCILGSCALINKPAQPSGLSFLSHLRYLTYGLEKSVAVHAVETLKDGDSGRVTWLFNQLALGDRHTFLKFAATIPISRIPELFPSINLLSFRASLFVLFRTVARTRPGLEASLDSDVLRRSLLVCLHAICHIAKAMAPIPPDLDFMRNNFANTGLMGALWNDDDNSIRIASRSICALVARQVVRKRELEGEDLHWLQEVTGSPSDAILEADVTVRDQMNFKAFIYGALSDQVTHLSTKNTRNLNETLAILLDVGIDDYGYFTSVEWQTRLSEEVGRIQLYDRQGGLELFQRLRSVFPSLPRSASAHAVVPPSHSVPSPVLPPSSELPPPRAPPSPGPVPRAPSPPPPRAIYPPHSIRPSHRAHRHHGPT